MNEQTALLVVDVQQDLFQKSTPVYQAADLICNIQTLVDAAHRAGAPVVYIQHNNKSGLLKDSAGWQLHPRLRPQEGDLQVDKQRSNAFEQTPLDELLRSRGVEHVVVTGMVSNICVKNTCLGAIALGYTTTLVSDAHSTDRQDAAKVIALWNAKLNQAGAEVKPAREITF
ncbi:MAG: cysteine hydrolase [Anaerolineaceae bacterium]|nr:cysteine hydrolase [Anaerolineaceae bacterium]